MICSEFSDKSLKEKYYKLSHKSGLEVYVFPKKLSTSYALFGTEYGSIDNRFRTEGEKDYTFVPDGIAHYLEHRMFTQKDGSDITERFSEFGADTNAYTSYTKTVYMCNATDNFENALEALINFVTEPLFTEELVERERGIIAQEIKMSDDSPYARSYKGLLEAMYKSNNVRVDIAGTVESISQITADMLDKCYNAFYNPNNMALVVCGDITPETVMEIVDRTLPETFVGKKVERNYCYDEPKEVYKKLCEDRMEVSKPVFTIGVKDCDISPDPVCRMRKFSAMALICELLFSRSGELYNYLFENGKIVPDFGGSYTTSKTFAFTTISGEADDPFEVLDYIKSYVSNYVCNEEELRRAKRVLYAEYVMDFDSTEEIANNMMDYIFEGFEIFEYGKILEDITVDEINELVKKMFKEEYFTMSVIYPLEDK